MTEINVSTCSEAWIRTQETVNQYHITSSPRGRVTREHPGPFHLEIWDPADFPLRGMTRDFRHAITAVEALSLIGQTSVPEMILDRVRAFRPFLNNSVFHGAYGPRVAGHLAEIVDLLRRDPDSRQAVLTLYDASKDLNRPAVLDVPCTTTIQFLLRGEELAMWVTMRSNDAWLGLPYDLGQFSLLQSAIAQALGATMGTYYHSAGSMHLYDRDWQASEAVRRTEDTPGLTLQDAWGSSDIGEISSRARRLLLGQKHLLENVTPVEEWLDRQLLLI